LKFLIRTPKLKFFDENGHQIIEANRPRELRELQAGQHISPFNTPFGRVDWIVNYVEEIDLDYTFIHVKNVGYVKE
jgi:hypothetical protein